MSSNCAPVSEELGTVTVEDLKNEQPKSQRKPSEVRKPTTETPNVEPAMGVSHLLDEALRDIEGAA
jgi:hypothetical protein